jgi:hypothetical protein
VNAFDRFETTDLPLFDEPVNPSAAAKASILDKLPDLRRKVLDALHRHESGLTDEELQDVCMMEPNTERPRRRELVQAGLVMDSGRRRPLKSGKAGTVWQVKR